MDRLPDVLLQLLMQLLRTADRLRFARCSSSVLHAADSPAAWRHCGMLLCSTGRGALPVPLSSSRLLRHPASVGGVALRWSHMHGLTDADCDRLLSSFSPIAELDCRACETKRGDDDDERISSASLLLILAHPSLVQLRSLSLPVDWPLGASVLQRLGQLSRLSHLHIAGSSPPLPDSRIMSALLTLPALTSLSTASIVVDPASSQDDLSAQLPLPPVVDLCMERAMFFSEGFELLFGRQLRLRSLQSLSLKKCATHRSQPLDWTVCVSLHTLHLREVMNVTHMLPALRLLKSLRSLTISPVPLSDSTDTHPLDSLVELLLHSHELRVTIFVVRPAFGEFVCPPDAAALYNANPEVRTLLADVTERFSVVPDETQH